VIGHLARDALSHTPQKQQNEKKYEFFTRGVAPMAFLAF